MALSPIQQSPVQQSQSPLSKASPSKNTGTTASCRSPFRLQPRHVFWLKVVIHVVSLSFLAQMVWLTVSGGFGADPIQGLHHFTGKAALNTLLLTLVISPVAKALKQGMLMKVRRLVGLYSFFWAVLHVMGYLVLDLNLNWSLLASEIVSRPYLSLGAVSWFILLALTLTSFSAVQQKMGKMWQKLHNWVYLVVLLAPIHYYWSVKSGLLEPALYIAASLALLALRYRTFSRGLSLFTARRRTSQR